MSSLISVIVVALLLAPQHPSMPNGMSHEEHLKQMEKDEALKKRGAEAMGFDQDATTHHFKLAASGGSIEITVKNEKDEAVIAAVRSHLRSIAADFAGGDFDKPFQTHGEVPQGVPGMQKSRQKITYRYEDLPQGGAVRIDTKDARALEAVHAFLRFQIKEHQTGDPKQDPTMMVRPDGCDLAQPLPSPIPACGMNMLRGTVVVQCNSRRTSW
jgi:hypothetical protein